MISISAATAALTVFSSLVSASTTTTSVPLLPAPTAPVTVEYVAERFKALDASLESLTCAFEQAVTWDESGTRQKVAGKLEYKKKDKLRVEHTLPEEQTIVSDGRWLWVHRDSTNQVIRTSLDAWKKSEPLARGLLDFGRYADLLARYDVKLASATDEPGGHKKLAVELRPKDDPKAFVLTLRFSTKDFFPADTELRVGGVAVRSQFRQIRYNPKIPDARFEFKPPAGADVFEHQ